MVKLTNVKGKMVAFVENMANAIEMNVRIGQEVLIDDKKIIVDAYPSDNTTYTKKQIMKYDYAEFIQDSLELFIIDNYADRFDQQTRTFLFTPDELIEILNMFLSEIKIDIFYPAELIENMIAYKQQQMQMIPENSDNNQIILPQDSNRELNMQQNSQADLFQESNTELNEQQNNNAT